ncbi:electrogenic sodium bicarbonate cotransporter 1-like isoform X14 [Amphibalanus amphitrite]|uniref:electrogenic sodium bicarbonate cotransporter 1-like isoform X14 n=2 Tax=Amphibalanus amphitrite TaxID=1232801 RepID=UPI001C917F0D|nr:electrogenic sodium bicarbonate cotransporter 1-like isoform X14 [Amphibalanus amphitrite]
MVMGAANKLLEPAKAFIDAVREPWPWAMDNVTENTDEPPRDPGAGRAHHSYTDKDFEGHRAHSLYVSVNPTAPSGHHRPHRSRRRHHRHHNHRDGDDDRPSDPVYEHGRRASLIAATDTLDPPRPRHGRRASSIGADGELSLTPPSQRVQFILGEEDAEGSGLEPHPLFSEMETLCEADGGQMEWKETARWVKFEEDVEEGGNRWSKPHVGTLSLHSLFELRSLILNGTVMLDMEATSLEHIADLLLDNLINSGAITYDKREQFREALLRRHKHLHDRKKASDGSSVGGSVARLPLIRSLADIGRSYSNAKMLRRADTFSGAAMADNTGDMHTSPSGVSLPDANGHANGTSTADLAKRNLQFMRKIPPGAEASNILVGEVDFLDKPVSAFLRLSTASLMGDLTEVPVPTRFIFLLLGPVGGISRYHEVGRAMATLLSDEVFHDVAYKAKNRNHLLAAVDEFLDAVTVLPPGEWDPTIRIEPPAAVPSQDPRKRPNKEDEEFDDEAEEEKYRVQSGLVRTGRLFGGLINDIKRKKPWYVSDFKDAIAVQSVASYIFLYFACLTPIVTFGGLLSDATGTRLAAIESLVSGLVCGVIYGFFSGQPLNILGSTGPMLVFEQIIYKFCTTNDIDYLSFRVWVGFWIAFYLLILVALDASAYVKYITRFTEENFATLIAFIFIIKAFEKVIHIGDHHEPAAHLFMLSDNCTCLPGDDSLYDNFTWPANFTWDGVEHATDCLLTFNGTLNGTACPDEHDAAHPLHVAEESLLHGCSDVFLMSILLFLLTFLIAINLKEFKSSPFFPNKVRGFISDFSVIIAIVCMTTVDYLAGIDTPKLSVPDKFQPTYPGRGWVIPLFNGNAWWTALAAALPALLGVILVFMDQQITAVIVNRKEHKLKKGGGYHLDLFVLAILVVILSILGLPWFVAATVLAINHVNSLKVESETAAPGEKPQFLGVRENRVTHILIFATIGLSVLMTPLLRMIPMPVLFGVFLYMGVSALKGLQFFDRILIMFMPAKYQPDYTFLRQVPLKRVHLFTFIQLMCLVVLWVIKSIFETSILFPLMLVVMIGIRKLLEKIFSPGELRVLDDVLPEFSRKKKQEEHDMLEEEQEVGKLPINESGNLEIPLASGNVMRIPLDSCNISEELNRSGVWKGINKENQQGRRDDDDRREDRKHRGHRRHKSSKREAPADDSNATRLTTMPEEAEEEEDAGITIKVGGNHHPEDREDKL